MGWKNAFLAAVTEFVPVKNAKGLKFLPWMGNRTRCRVSILYVIRSREFKVLSMNRSIVLGKVRMHVVFPRYQYFHCVM